MEGIGRCGAGELVELAEGVEAADGTGLDGLEVKDAWWEGRIEGLAGFETDGPALEPLGVWDLRVDVDYGGGCYVEKALCNIRRRLLEITVRHPQFDRVCNLDLEARALSLQYSTLACSSRLRDSSSQLKTCRAESSPLCPKGQV